MTDIAVCGTIEGAPSSLGEANLSTGEDTLVYSLTEAAEYLGLSRSAVETYVYRQRALKPDGDVNGAFWFYKKTLDEFQEALNERRQLIFHDANGERLYTVSQAARYLHMKVATFSYHYRRGAVKADEMCGKRALFRKETLVAFRGPL